MNFLLFHINIHYKPLGKYHWVELLILLDNRYLVPWVFWDLLHSLQILHLIRWLWILRLSLWLKQRNQFLNIIIYRLKNSQLQMWIFGLKWLCLWFHLGIQFSSQFHRCFFCLDKISILTLRSSCVHFLHIFRFEWGQILLFQFLKCYFWCGIECHLGIGHSSLHLRIKLSRNHLLECRTCFQRLHQFQLHMGSFLYPNEFHLDWLFWILYN